MSDYTLKTIRELGSRRPDDEQKIINDGWPEFMLHDPIGNDYFGRLYRNFPDFQFCLYDGETMVAAANCIPVIWDLDPAHLYDAGWDWALESGFHNFQFERAPTTLCALSITVAKGYQGKGVSAQAIQAMKALAVQNNFNALIAPVRPSLKQRYPLTPMKHYITWTQAGQSDGAPFDPWLRTHWRLGAKIVKIAPHSMVIPGSVDQ
ncbi:MAG: hypothetical protein ABI700_04800, partial [Chloroflexota bacterium]